MKFESNLKFAPSANRAKLNAVLRICTFDSHAKVNAVLKICMKPDVQKLTRSLGFAPPKRANTNALLKICTP